METVVTGDAELEKKRSAKDGSADEWVPLPPLGGTSVDTPSSDDEDDEDYKIVLDAPREMPVDIGLAASKRSLTSETSLPEPAWVSTRTTSATTAAPTVTFPTPPPPLTEEGQVDILNPKAPWNQPGVDIRQWFGYGMTPQSYLHYRKHIDYYMDMQRSPPIDEQRLHFKSRSFMHRGGKYHHSGRMQVQRQVETPSLVPLSTPPPIYPLSFSSTFSSSSSSPPISVASSHDSKSYLSQKHGSI